MSKPKCDLCNKNAEYASSVFVQYLKADDKVKDPIEDYNLILCAGCKNLLAKALLSNKPYTIQPVGVKGREV